LSNSQFLSISKNQVSRFCRKFWLRRSSVLRLFPYYYWLCKLVRYYRRHFAQCQHFRNFNVFIVIVKEIQLGQHRQISNDSNIGTLFCGCCCASQIPAGRCSSVACSCPRRPRTPWGMPVTRSMVARNARDDPRRRQPPGRACTGASGTNAPGRTAAAHTGGHCSRCCGRARPLSTPWTRSPATILAPRSNTKVGRLLRASDPRDTTRVGVNTPAARAAVLAAAAYPRCCAGGPRRGRRLQPAAASMKGIQGRAAGATVAVDTPINVPRSVGRVGDEVVGGHVDAAVSRSAVGGRAVPAAPVGRRACPS
jgi:hypothetical protein